MAQRLISALNGLLLLPLHTASALLLGVAVFPHGDFAADPDLLPPASPAYFRAAAIHDGCVELAKSITTLNPDGILIVSPHGVALSREYNIYLSSNASGYAALGGDLHNASFPNVIVPLAFPLDSGTSNELVALLAAEGVTGMLPWADSEPVPLRWGEVIPLSFLSTLLNGSSTPRVSVWTQPLTRYNFSAGPMVTDLLRVGGIAGAYLQASPKRYLVIVSADLSHVHSNPYVMPYGANDTAADTFDGAVGLWLRYGSQDQLLANATSVAPWAMSCGVTGLVLAQGMMNGVRQGAWTSELIAGPVAPTYYGMAVGLILQQ